jgi:DNA-binding NarL/FixJ family response regulator
MNARPLATAHSVSPRPTQGTNRHLDHWRIAVVAPQALMRDLLSRWLGRLGDAGDVEALSDAADLEGRIHSGQRFHLVVVGCLGIGWPQLLAAMPRADQLAGIPVIIVPERDDPDLVAAALRAGIRGIVPTTLTPAVASAAVRLVLSGGTYVPARSAIALPVPDSDPAAAALAGLGLTPREIQVVGLLRKGCSNRAIARELGISESTVVVHVRKLMQKVSATNRAQAVYLIHQHLRDHPEAPPPALPDQGQSLAG